MFAFCLIAIRRLSVAPGPLNLIRWLSLFDELHMASLRDRCMERYRSIVAYPGQMCSVLEAEPGLIESLSPRLLDELKLAAAGNAGGTGVVVKG